LSSPRVLFCPKDSKSSNASSARWTTLNVSQISYELASPGMSANASGGASAVLVRCPVHGHTCMGDGSVRQGTTTGNR
jgi:hypothetical protein